MSERFYVDQPLGPGLALLQGAEAHHLAVVCRLRAGDAVRLFNGDGLEYPATVVHAGKKRVELEVGEPARVDRELPFRLLVACPLPKGDRGQFLIEKLTETGVTEFVPLRTARSVVHPGERRSEKLERYVIEAAKQCGRNVLMRIAPLQPLSELLNRPDLPVRRLLAHPGGNPVVSAARAAGDVAILVGPEGGFSEEELAEAHSRDWKVVDLGKRVLRVETAALGVAFLLASLAAEAT